MDSSGGIPDPYSVQTSTGAGGLPRRFGFLPSNFIQAPLSALLEYSGILRVRSVHSESETSIGPGRIEEPGFASGRGAGEVEIRIIGVGDEDGFGVGTSQAQSLEEDAIPGGSGLQGELHGGSSQWRGRDGESDIGVVEVGSSSSALPISISSGVGSSSDGEVSAAGGNNRDSSYQRYEIQEVARWIEQVLPFSLLLLVVFIRQHLQGFFITIWMAAVMLKSNDILRKQTALKGERRIVILIGITIVFTMHVFGVLYWWYRADDLLYPLVMLPPKRIPPFWHAIFIIMVNDIMVRQAAMVVKCVLLMYYKNSKGRKYRKQGQMLTLVEYALLLYRALLPTPVWYRFFLNKEYGSIFSSLTTGLYLTFKLTSVVEKVQSLITSLKALSRKDAHYGSYATTEQVISAGDMCAICQEKMHAPILLSCKHIFCEDCVSEWFERERTCPLCRALVKPADLRSFADGSTSLHFQLF
ncbi:RING finger and transmembrane domain-containing protein 2-like [Zingiber officinale]|uniref:RING finger and transmembrane domain-containing protein 2-like n=1 Tax=Zingiber officinale TaxID=94328 RepID=UPI001C4B9509|nr:RING finger and transmembrane domain-containing protein 2-like [Zingiber officinale]